MSSTFKLVRVIENKKFNTEKFNDSPLRVREAIKTVRFWTLVFSQTCYHLGPRNLVFHKNYHGQKVGVLKSSIQIRLVVVVVMVG